MTETEKIITASKDEIIEVVSKKLIALTSGTEDYTIAWKKLQDDAAEVIIQLLSGKLKNTNLTSPSTKSTYPDVKIINADGVFAIDIKCNERSKDPWFDMARIDTMMIDRIEKYKEEWEMVIQYDSQTGKFIKCFFTLFREAVGIREECKGVKYRPYDGKIRPKSWADFENEKIYWKSKEEFIQGIELSLKHRWKENIKAILVPNLSAEEKEEFKKLFD